MKPDNRPFVRPFWSSVSASQIVIGDNELFPIPFHSQAHSGLWTNTLMFPAYFVTLSVLLLIIHALLVSGPVKKLLARTRDAQQPPAPAEPLLVPSPDIRTAISEHIRKTGGLTIVSYKAVRFVACLALLGLSATSLVLEEVRRSEQNGFSALGKWGKKHRGRKRKSRAFTTKEWLHVAMCLTYLYASLIGLLSITAKHRVRKIVTRHLNALLVVTFAVYAYRDIFPLATYNRTLLDASEGRLLWAKLGILTVAAVIVPLFIPRLYIPVDPKEPMEVPSPELTASLVSLLTYKFLDPIVFTAYRIEHLAFDQLPPLADYDFAKNLRAKSFKHLDVFSGAKKRHLFFGLIYIFRVEYMVLATMIIVHVLCTFAAPVGIYQLLSYIETKGQGATIKPWLWIIWLFVGPAIGSISLQWYIFLATRTLVRGEAIITQLVFEHSLRIRVKAETSSSEGSSVAASTSPSTPDSASINHSAVEGSDSSDETTPSVGATEDTYLSNQETLQDSSASIDSSTLKGKKEERKPEEKTSSNLIGKIQNLVTTDLNNIVEARDFLFMILYIPVQISFCIWFLYVVLGWSAFVGLAVILVTFPVPGLVAKLVQKVQEERLKKSDARVESVTEAMNVLRMIKLFGWERKMGDRIAEKREQELIWIKKRQFLDLLNGSLNFVIPVLTMVATFATYVCTVIMKQELNASKVFSSISVFDMLRDQLHMVFYSITASMTGKVSLDRVTEFLRETELLDAYAPKKDQPVEVEEINPAPSGEIGFNKATFTWSNAEDGSLTPSRRRFALRIEDQLTFRRGCVNLIVGPTGSGKTSLLMALLGEMHYVATNPDSWFNLPRDNGVAYASQTSWVQNETIRENIVFGAEFDEARYKSVLHVCGLERDLELFEAGDAQEVGEKGLTLSGGQKARITLARAIYSSAELLLLDDVLAALDVHTSKWIVDKCFKGDLVKGRTIILVTHNVAMVRPIAKFVVSVHDGRAVAQGSPSEVISKDKDVAAEVQKDEEAIEKAGEEFDAVAPSTEQSDGKLIVAEEVELGHISWPALQLYLKGLGGNHPFFFFLAFLGGLVLTEISNTLQTWYLGYWASQYDKHPPSEVPVFYYLGIYGLFLFSAVVLYCVAYAVYVYGALRAARSIHKQLVDAVMGTTLRWLDTTPTSRVIARATQDIRAVDGPIASMLYYLIEMTLSMLIKFSAVVLITPVFLIPGVVVAALGGFCGQVYIKAQLAVKREMSNAKAPVLGHFGASIAGLTSIRAYGVQQTFVEESLRRINRYTRTARTFYNLNRWVCIRIDALGGLFAAGLATYLVYFQSHQASTTGFSLNMAVGFSGMILWWVRILNEFEVQGNSLERIETYVNIEQEAKPTQRGQPPAYWPSSGNLHVEGLSARYSPDGPKVLHDISFDIKSGERIGVVGRTGSGKSSLTLALLRCIYTHGTVEYDGIPTSDVNLDALRSNITIIPQMPELLSGTLRQNLDPFEQYDDAVLNDALRSAGLFALQSDTEEGRLNLDSPISSGGDNLSVGQRQILALARAIVRGSKLLILDEATSAIDYKTDSIIQTSLRKELKGDVTLITIAHRLQTIMDADKIMVLDAGRIVEFASPTELLKNEKGRLRSLVDESGDKDALYAMAAGDTEK